MSPSRRDLEEVSSRVYPSLERKPGKQNWVDNTGGLPSYIERIAKHLHYERGMTIGHAIASAVNKVKKWAVTGKPDTKAKAIKAVAEWEAKKAKSKAKTAAKNLKESLEMSEARELLESGANLELSAEDEADLTRHVQRRLLVAEGMLTTLSDHRTRGKARLVRSAIELMEAELAEPVKLARLGGEAANREDMKATARLLRQEVSELRLLAESLAVLEKPAEDRVETSSEEDSEAPEVETEAPEVETEQQGLQRGDTGAEVAEMQRQVIAMGSHVGDAEDDGKFGPATARGVKAIQRREGLKADGVVGPKTKEMLNANAEVEVPSWQDTKRLDREPIKTPKPPVEMEEATLDNRVRGAALSGLRSLSNRDYSQIKRLADGTFAPLGRGRVLRPGAPVTLGSKRGIVSPDGKKIQLVGGEMLDLTKKAQAPSAPNKPDAPALTKSTRRLAPELDADLNPDFAAGVKPSDYEKVHGMASPDLEIGKHQTPSGHYIVHEKGPGDKWKVTAVPADGTGDGASQHYVPATRLKDWDKNGIPVGKPEREGMASPDTGDAVIDKALDPNEPYSASGHMDAVAAVQDLPDGITKTQLMDELGKAGEAKRTKATGVPSGGLNSPKYGGQGMASPEIPVGGSYDVSRYSVTRTKDRKFTVGSDGEPTLEFSTHDDAKNYAQTQMLNDPTGEGTAALLRGDGNLDVTWMRANGERWTQPAEGEVITTEEQARAAAPSWAEDWEIVAPGWVVYAGFHDTDAPDWGEDTSPGSSIQRRMASMYDDGEVQQLEVYGPGQVPGEDYPWEREGEMYGSSSEAIREYRGVVAKAAAAHLAKLATGSDKNEMASPGIELVRAGDSEVGDEIMPSTGKWQATNLKVTGRDRDGNVLATTPDGEEAWVRPSDDVAFIAAGDASAAGEAAPTDAAQAIYDIQDSVETEINGHTVLKNKGIGKGYVIDGVDVAKVGDAIKAVSEGEMASPAWTDGKPLRWSSYREDYLSPFESGIRIKTLDGDKMYEVPKQKGVSLDGELHFEAFAIDEKGELTGVGDAMLPNRTSYLVGSSETALNDMASPATPTSPKWVAASEEQDAYYRSAVDELLALNPGESWERDGVTVKKATTGDYQLTGVNGPKRRKNSMKGYALKNAVQTAFQNKYGDHLALTPISIENREGGKELKPAQINGRIGRTKAQADMASPEYPEGFDPTLAQRGPYTKELDDSQSPASWTIRDKDGKVEQEGITSDHDAASILDELNALESGKGSMLSPAVPELYEAGSPVRSPAGRIRNVKSMMNDKLLFTLEQQSYFHENSNGVDPDGLQAIKDEVSDRLSGKGKYPLQPADLAAIEMASPDLSGSPELGSDGVLTQLLDGDTSVGEGIDLLDGGENSPLNIQYGKERYSLGVGGDLDKAAAYADIAERLQTGRSDGTYTGKGDTLSLSLGGKKGQLKISKLPDWNAGLTDSQKAGNVPAVRSVDEFGNRYLSPATAADLANPDADIRYPAMASPEWDRDERTVGELELSPDLQAYLDGSKDWGDLSDADAMELDDLIRHADKMKAGDTPAAQDWAAFRDQADERRPAGLFPDPGFPSIRGDMASPEFDEEAYTINDPAMGEMIVTGPDGKSLGSFIEQDDALKAIRDDMEAEQYWPSVQRVGERGDIDVLNPQTGDIVEPTNGMLSPDMRLSNEREAALRTGNSVTLPNGTTVDPNGTIAGGNLPDPVDRKQLPLPPAIALRVAEFIDASADLEDSDSVDPQADWSKTVEAAGINPESFGMASPGIDPNPVALPDTYKDNVEELEFQHLPLGTTFSTVGGYTYVLHKKAGDDGKWYIAKPVDADGNIILNDPHPDVNTKSSHGPTRRILFWRQPPRAIGPMHPDYVTETPAVDVPDAPVAYDPGLVAYEAGSPVRAASGNKRNVKAMGNAKFVPLYKAMQSLGDIDPDGLNWVNDEYNRRTQLDSSDPKYVSPATLGAVDPVEVAPQPKVATPAQATPEDSLVKAIEDSINATPSVSDPADYPPAEVDGPKSIEAPVVVQDEAVPSWASSVSDELGGDWSSEQVTRAVSDLEQKGVTLDPDEEPAIIAAVIKATGTKPETSMASPSFDDDMGGYEPKNEEDIQNLLATLDGDLPESITDVRTYEDVGMMSDGSGLVITLKGGEEFQLSIESDDMDQDAADSAENRLRAALSSESGGMASDDFYDLENQFPQTQSFNDVGRITGNKGLVLTDDEGRKISVTIVQSKSGESADMNSPSPVPEPDPYKPDPNVGSTVRRKDDPTDEWTVTGRVGGLATRRYTLENGIGDKREASLIELQDDFEVPAGGQQGGPGVGMEPDMNSPMVPAGGGKVSDVLSPDEQAKLAGEADDMGLVMADEIANDKVPAASRLENLMRAVVDPDAKSAAATLRDFALTGQASSMASPEVPEVREEDNGPFVDIGPDQPWKGQTAPFSELAGLPDGTRIADANGRVWTKTDGNKLYSQGVMGMVEIPEITDADLGIAAIVDNPATMSRSELLKALGLENSDLSDSELAERLKAKRAA